MRSLIILALCGVMMALGASANDCPQGLCSSSETCCDGPSPGTYGCCPEKNAVCCSDGEHCCPANTVCDLDAGTCDSNNDLIPIAFQPKPKRRPLVATNLEVAKKVEVVYCPGGTAFCPDNNTCCFLYTGQWGCCPYPNAVCCPDKYHCCPQNTHCDSTSTMCLSSDSSATFKALFKHPALTMA